MFMAGHAPALVGECVEWTSTVNTASYCKALNGKPIFSALYGTYNVTFIELKAMLKASILANQDKSPKNQKGTINPGRRLQRIL
jgi:hypothetical protein